MGLSALTIAEQGVVWRCIEAIRDGPFIDDWEFHPRLGLERSELQELTSNVLTLDDSDPKSDEWLAINNCMVEILYGVRITPEQWVVWIGDDMKEEVERIYEKWCKSHGLSSGGIA